MNFNFFLDKDIKKSKILSSEAFLENPDFLCLVGSKLYSTQTEDSDTDVRGFTFLPTEYTLGLKSWEIVVRNKDKADIVIWSVDKFFKMLLSGSTVAFEMLYAPDEVIIHLSERAKEIRRHRAKFVSKQTIGAMLGYANSEWRKVLGEVTKDLGAKRKEHIEQIGYSYKNAYHAVRILQQGYELIEYQHIDFFSNREFLKAVKIGIVPFAEMESVFKSKLNKLENIYNTMSNEFYFDFINNLLCRLKLQKIISELIPVKTHERIFYEEEKV